jgi:hypothetical protein
MSPNTANHLLRPAGHPPNDCVNNAQAASAAVMLDTGVAIDYVYLASDTQPTSVGSED